MCLLDVRSKLQLRVLKDPTSSYGLRVFVLKFLSVNLCSVAISRENKTWVNNLVFFLVLKLKKNLLMTVANLSFVELFKICFWH